MYKSRTAQSTSSASSAVIRQTEDEDTAVGLEEGNIAGWEDGGSTAEEGGGRGAGDRRRQEEYNSASVPAPITTARRINQRRAGGEGGGRNGEGWDFERLATTPLLAAAFDDFSRKALCHESVLFLSEVSR